MKNDILKNINKQVNSLASVNEKNNQINNFTYDKEEMTVLNIRIPKKWKIIIKQKLRKEGIEEMSVAIRKLIIDEFNLD